ncbi:MAG: hypothetical protein EA405_13660 [Rhodospirillales bacterium]|nr:MAG: hypothetical protein EA405_13660 [Rhodospirillales bacterium]
MIEGFRIANPAAYALPEVHEFVLRAFSKGATVGPRDALMELIANAQNESLVVMMWREGGLFRGMAVVILPVSRLMPAASVLHFYTEGTGRLRSAMANSIVEVVKSAGFDKIETMNLRSGRDAAFERMWRTAGKVSRVGTLFEIDIGGDDGRDS